MTRTTTAAAPSRAALPQRAALAMLAGVAAAGTLASCAAGAADAEEPRPTATETVEATPAPASTAPAATAPTGSASAYVDGTYTADGSYLNPDGGSSVTVTVTIQDDVVTEVAVVGHATSGNSRQFQGQFASGIAAEVVGKPLDEVDVSRVAGSSLTSGGFNAAIDAIQEQAKA